ncbi:MAG: GNAT family N-acetyltransferase [Sarcina sp.]
MIEIKNRANNDILVKAEFEKLTVNSIDEILKFQDLIIDGLEDKSFFAKTSKNEFIDYFERNSYFLGLREKKENQLIAFGLYLHEGLLETNYGYDLDYSVEEIEKTGQIEITIVHPDFRGNRLQKILCDKMIEVAKKNGDYTVAATVSPENLHSLNTFLKLGFIINKEKLKYGGVLRCILEYKL